jgi:enoyl-CoA hydratase/carnithine racemase
MRHVPSETPKTSTAAETPAAFETITLETHGSVATVTLSRPAALNAITAPMLEELNTAFATIETDPAVVVAVLTGEGRAFSAGVDLKALGERSLQGGKVGDILDVPARALTRRLTTMAVIVIAKVNGFCFTGALELALACDLMVVAEEATLGDTHAKWGLRPTWGMSQRLPRAVGAARARELSFTARNFTGVEAAAWGMATRAVPRAELDAAVEELAAAISGNSRAALAASKDLYRATAGLPLDGGLAYEYGTDYPIADADERLAGFR